MDKCQIFKCAACNAELDEATETITWINENPYCVYCWPHVKLPRGGGPVIDIIKTWPAYFPRDKVLEVFAGGHFQRFYFSVGKGKPSQPVRNLWYTHAGDILGYFRIGELVFNENERTLPRLRSITNQESQWQFRPGIWVAICPGPFVPLEEKLRYSGFRGWRYFEIEKHRGSIDALVAI